MVSVCQRIAEQKSTSVLTGDSRKPGADAIYGNI